MKKVFVTTLLLLLLRTTMAQTFERLVVPLSTSTPWYSTGWSCTYDVKNYSIVPINEPIAGISDHYAMAGTIFENTYTDNFGNPIGEGIHFKRVYNDGTGVSCANSGSAPSASWEVGAFYKDLNFIDERCVKILTKDETDNIIVEQVRDANSNQDKIKVLIIDNCGLTISFDTVLSFSNSPYNIYALDAMYDQANNRLYIGGYMSYASSYYPNYPDYTTYKSMMLIMYDLSSGLCFLSPYNTAPRSGAVYNNDYDMVTRLKMLSNGNIFVTGSCNIFTAYGLGSGTLAMIVDPYLSPVSAFYPLAITDQTYLENTDRFEYGFDVQETNDGYYIFSNKFTEGTNYMGYNPLSKYIAVTYIDNKNLLFPTYTQRLHIYSGSYPNEKWAWGSKTFTSTNTPGSFVLSGLQTYGDAACFSGIIDPGPNNTNALPFLSEINPIWNNSTRTLNGTVSFWNTYLTQNATTSFPSLGGGLSNISWSNMFATRNDGISNDFVFIAPWKNTFLPTAAMGGTPSLKLNYKIIRTDATGLFSNPINSTSSPVCDNAYVVCPPTISTVYANNDTNDYKRAVTFNGIIDKTQGNSQIVSDFWTFSGIHCVTSDPYYKQPTSTRDIIQGAVDLIIYPNPATDNITLRYSGKNETNLNAGLYDLTGRFIKTLYNGTSAQLKLGFKVSLPNLATGVYLIKTNTGGKESYQKIMVQQ